MATTKKVITKKAATKKDKVVVKKSAIATKKKMEEEEDRKIKKSVIAKKAVIPKSKELDEIESDDTIDIVAFDRKYNDKILEVATSSRSRTAVDLCPQGKQPKVTRDNPVKTGPLNRNKYITELHVTLSTQSLRITWSDAKEEFVLCSPNPTKTPRGSFIVGFKCGAKHTNYKRDGMAWFTALAKYGMVYGFHNSQRVGLGVVSHGCIRILCKDAKRINQNSWSGVTKIRIVK
jgi:hypothetical protein